MKKRQQYEKYKNSGVEWIGDIPITWKKVRFKDKVYFKEGPGILAKDFSREGTPLIRITNVKTNLVQGPFKQFLSQELKAKYSSCITRVGDLIISGSASTGIMSVVDRKTAGAIPYTGLFILRCINNSILVNFLKYYLQSNSFIEQINQFKTGSTIEHFGPTHLSQIYLALGGVEEQQRIANFLDEKTSQIDNLIKKQEKLIELLQEKRQALISHAVTKGLDSNVKMKDSGIEWLGEIPEHWIMGKIKHFLSIPITDGPHETPLWLDEGVPFVSAEAIKQNRINFDKKRGFISHEQYLEYVKKYKPENGDVLMVKSGNTTGNVGIVETEDIFMIWSPLAVFRGKNVLDQKYIYYVLQSNSFQEQVKNKSSYGTQPNIGMQVLENLYISFPKLDEQKIIVDLLDREVSKLDLIVERSLKAIELLKEKKQSLISHAVTGKIKVI